MKKQLFLFGVLFLVNFSFAQTQTPISDWLSQAEVEYTKCKKAYNLSYTQYQNTGNDKFWLAIKGEYEAIDSIAKALDSLSSLKELEEELVYISGWNRFKFIVLGKQINSYQKYIDMYLEAIESFQDYVPKDGSASNDATILNIIPIKFPYDTERMRGLHFIYRAKLTKKK